MVVAGSHGGESRGSREVRSYEECSLFIPGMRSCVLGLPRSHFIKSIIISVNILVGIVVSWLVLVGVVKIKRSVL